MSQENVELVRRGFDAFNRRDRSAWLALAHPDLEWLPPADWPENTMVRGSEAVWDFAVRSNEPWEKGFSYELIELIDCENDVVAAHAARAGQGERHRGGVRVLDCMHVQQRETAPFRIVH
jgi:ketosteroid isomerase-like protein